MYDELKVNISPYLTDQKTFQSVLNIEDYQTILFFTFQLRCFVEDD